MSSVRRAEGPLQELLVASALPSSKCSAALLDLVQPLIESGVLIWERSGAGRRLVVQDSSILAKFIAQIYPNAASASGLARVRSVAKYRDSKVLANDSPEIVSMRFLTERGPADAVEWTKQFGVCAFDLRSAPKLTGVCALIENPALFFDIENLRLGIDIALLARGRASDQLLQWLALDDSMLVRILHFPDYDPVGLSEFARVRSRLGERVHLYRPNDLEQRFALFSNPGLLLPHKSSELLGALRNAADLDVRRIVTLMDRYNAGLEQEALLIPLPNVEP